ncbi:hypothetical protein COU19_00480 [Candidatus Kaiserbacteria bacterium CG10_big_fil_rev_8_21_14_0_10_56_12]|uniref:Uncharacterized protein n=1 Tax=Candidatus Kaiserbacteria bacterium CG10_big_fil_rev_8_21_14_0_10_56_12 TaxID=1974611 RepID=A0A2H0UAH3_9BACT|nr:MAG: hypothetical protein COU19_00480 [Candidatus Kaiserbacteria bacterium CG10_big_fil_rev_8_21_14_0_10_56_12]
MTKTAPLLLLYETSQADLTVPGARVVSMNAWLDALLTERRVPHLSLETYTRDRGRMTELATEMQRAARDWYRRPELAFFSHRGIRLGEAMEPMVSAYFARVVYWRYVLSQVLDANPDCAELIIPEHDGNVSAYGGVLAPFESTVAVDCARALADEHGLLLRTIGQAPRPPEEHLFPQSPFQSFLVKGYNALMSLAPRRVLKLYASEYWRNIKPFMQNMPDAELVLMDRAEFFHIPWRELWRHRVRFLHPQDVRSAHYARASRGAVEAFRAGWKTARETLSQWDEWGKVDIPWATIEPELTYVVTRYAERVVADIERFTYLLKTERPDKVLLRASIGGRQPHFFLLARIARSTGVVSIELQHAGAHIDPRSVLSRLETDYLASYGEYENRWYRRNGYAADRLRAIGSPRFDRCISERGAATAKGEVLFREAGLALDRPILVAAVPYESIGFAVDSYAIARFLRSLVDVHACVPELQIVCKFRPGPIPEGPRHMLARLLPSAVCMGREDLFSLVCASHLVVCGNSTVIYEALLANRPLLLHPWAANDQYHAEMYAPAAPIVYDPQELGPLVKRVLTDTAYKKELVARGQQFLAGYYFDGQSAKRMSSLLRENLTPPEGL